MIRSSLVPLSAFLEINLQPVRKYLVHGINELQMKVKVKDLTGGGSGHRADLVISGLAVIHQKSNALVFEFPAWPPKGLLFVAPNALGHAGLRGP